MAITIDTLDEIFAVTQNDIELIIGQCKEQFYKPEIDRETVKMWVSLPLMLREAITAKNPKLGNNLDKKAEKLRKGDVTYGI